jgi:hypothetical protein
MRVETREVATLVRGDGAVIELAGAASVGKEDAPVRLVHRNGAWWASGGLALIDGEPSSFSVQLVEGSEIAAARASWRLRTVKQTLHRELMREAAILDAPDDEGCWRVYLDWLMDHDDVLVREPEAEHSAHTWLEVLERKHGFVTAARVRGGFGALPDDVEAAVRAVVSMPRMRFLRRLELQPLSWMRLRDAVDDELVRALEVEVEVEGTPRQDDVDDALEQAIRAFERVTVPGIDTLTLGPFWEGTLPDFSELHSADWKLPRLFTKPRQCVRWHARAWLQVNEREHTVREDNPWGVQLGPGGWVVPWSHVFVNGRKVRGAVYLCDGDTLRSGENVAVFRAA